MKKNDRKQNTRRYKTIEELIGEIANELSKEIADDGFFTVPDEISTEEKDKAYREAYKEGYQAGYQDGRASRNWPRWDDTYYGVAPKYWL